MKTLYLVAGAALAILGANRLARARQSANAITEGVASTAPGWPYDWFGDMWGRINGTDLRMYAGTKMSPNEQGSFHHLAGQPKSPDWPL